MFSKLKFVFLMFLSCFTIFSVGFASWNISGTSSSTNASGFIQVDNVINNKECIYMENGTPSYFSYGEKGFVDANNHFVKRGNVSGNYKINLEQCKEIFSDFDSLKVNIILEYDKSSVTYNLFEPIEGKFGFSPTVEYQGSAITDYTVTGINDYKYTISFDLIDVLKNYDTTSNPLTDLAINYNWIVEDSTYFKDYIFPELFNSTSGEGKLNFTMSATIEGM